MGKLQNVLRDSTVLCACLCMGFVICVPLILIAGCGKRCPTPKPKPKIELVKEGKIVDFDYVGRVSTTVQFTFEDGTVIRVYELDEKSRKNVRIGQTGKLYSTEDVPGKPYYGLTYTWTSNKEENINAEQIDEKIIKEQTVNVYDT